MRIAFIMESYQHHNSSYFHNKLHIKFRPYIGKGSICRHIICWFWPPRHIMSYGTEMTWTSQNLFGLYFNSFFANFSLGHYNCQLVYSKKFCVEFFMLFLWLNSYPRKICHIMSYQTGNFVTSHPSIWQSYGTPPFLKTRTKFFYCYIQR